MQLNLSTGAEGQLTTTKYDGTGGIMLQNKKTVACSIAGRDSGLISAVTGQDWSTGRIKDLCVLLFFRNAEGLTNRQCIDKCVYLQYIVHKVLVLWFLKRLE